MAVSEGMLTEYATSFEQVFGTRPQRYVCPIRLQPVPDVPIISGHVLNDSLSERRTAVIPMYSDIDNFYGTRVEGGLVYELNRLMAPGEVWLRQSKHLRLQFGDGSTVPLIPAKDSGDLQLDRRFPRVLLKAGGQEFWFHAKMDRSDTRQHLACAVVDEPEVLSVRVALLKAAYLAMFFVFKYRVSEFAPLDPIRRMLAKYFADNASREQLESYFATLNFDVKFILVPDPQSRIRRTRFAFDSIHDHCLLFHRAESGLFFATSVVFSVNDGSIAVTLPNCWSQVEGNRAADVAAADAIFARYRRDPTSLVHTIHPVRLKDNQLELQEQPLRINFVTDELPPALIE